ncbi:MAG: ATP-binding protein, partial [Ghiorsea sp.]|nr:ATP-binding protein [Ghiorsea sp.]
CHGDEVQIAQALAQMIENAHDAIIERWKQRGRESEGHIGITLSQENIELKLAHGDALQSGLYTCITVSDDGWGVPEDMQEQVFNPFTTSKRAGRGLGLAVAKSIVQRHGGQVSFESDVGKGSLFRMYLPMIKIPS